MASLPVCLVLLTLSALRPGAAAVASTVRVRAGEDATLHCPLLDGSGASGAPAAGPTTISWYRKAPGRGPELLLSLASTNGSQLRYGDGVHPGKVSATAGGSLLLLRGSEQSDAAVYYCGVSHGSDHKRGLDPESYTGE
ncbi:secreted immunoglobulin domain 1 [Cololabis saira]|uniref:secreted immunoglobulin domain 1 n=1 Tax=Cololabis saira TaxID=129043 RepID=UPI002AD4860D|nr:secreted immunoglobulin domain 1 [Cololabis saira]